MFAIPSSDIANMIKIVILLCKLKSMFSHLEKCKDFLIKAGTHITTLESLGKMIRGLRLIGPSRAAVGMLERGSVKLIYRPSCV